MKKTYVVKYNDGVFAESITFTDKDESFIEDYLVEEISKFNENINSDYHITRDSIHLVD